MKRVYVRWDGVLKECECGCGESANRGRRFIAGHHLRGITLPPEHRAKLSEARRGKKYSESHRRNLALSKMGSRNPAWRGQEATYKAIHKFLCESYEKLGVCDRCEEPAATEYALIRGRTYSRDRSDYQELCHLCHAHYDWGKW